MAKVTDLREITLSSLSNEDVFHMVDLSGDSIIGSRKLSYEVLKQGIDRDIEKVQVIDGCSYLSATKTIELSVKLSDGSMKVLSIDMEKLNIYHTGDGLSTNGGDDNTFVVDWDKVARREHEHETYVSKDDVLSVINDNEISNYVKGNERYVKIGGSSQSHANGAVSLGFGANANKPSSIAIGDTSHAYGDESIAIGKGSEVSVNVKYACQIGSGTNTLSNTLQFLSTQIVNQDGVIPNKSLELCSVNGILSSDGKGNIIGTEESYIVRRDVWSKTDSLVKKSEISACLSSINDSSQLPDIINALKKLRDM